MTPLMKQYSEIKSKYLDTILLFRMGDFYETFNEDAKTVSKILGITLTKRANGSASDVPLAGFPYHALNSHLFKLIQAGNKVAICEQLEDPKLAKNIVKRGVTEVITPGTAISENYLQNKLNNFLGVILENKGEYGLAFIDNSTGQFFVGECEERTLLEILLKFSPKEMIVSSEYKYESTDWYKKLRPFVTENDSWSFDFEICQSILLEHFSTKSLSGFGCDSMTLGIAAAGAGMRYIKQTLLGEVNHLTKLVSIRNEDFLGLDDFTIRNLELFHSLSTQGAHGTLISVMDKTVTSGGGRLLRHRLNTPLTDGKKIEKRLVKLEGFLSDRNVRKKVSNKLSETSDLERIVGKLNRRKANPKDVIGLKQTLMMIPEIQSLLDQSENSNLMELSDSFLNADHIIDRIQNTIVDSPPFVISDGGIIKEGISIELDELREISSGGKQWIYEMESKEKENTGITSLKVGYNKVFGYYLSVTKTHAEKVPDTWIRKQTLVNAERYVTPELKEYEEKILTADERIGEIELGLFNELREWILEQAELIQQNAEVLNQIDLFASLALLAQENRYVKPALNDIPIIKLKGSRHPVIESILPAGEKFVENDLELSADDTQIILLTGPNMAGKSTYLRQIGLIVIMAQMGSFVPAESAEIGIVDKLFTRVGASDNLAGGESTFLVEMVEAANILNNATPRSLVLFDEIGRGTSTYDGLSLAWAITEYLHNTAESACLTVFATHYHELTELEKLLERVKNYNVAVKEFGDKIVFLRKIVEGPTDKSYGIHVAQMAGIPKPVIVKATQILNNLTGQDSSQNLLTRSESFQTGSEAAQDVTDQMELFAQKELELKKKLSSLDIDNMTPLEALKKLNEIKSDFEIKPDLEI